MSEMTPEAAAKLREPFPESAIGILPKPYKKDSPKGNCDVCHGYHGLPAVHLDYVGHAAATDRLLSVDPEWSWEPMAFDGDGGPLIRRGGNEAEMWIRLTVCGVTRIGVGTVSANSFELSKQLIGDAIRNAAMRFGVALDLWAKEDLHDIQTPPAAPEPAKPMTDEQSFRITEGSAGLSVETRAVLNAWYKEREFPKIEELSFNQAEQVIQQVTTLEEMEPF